MIWLIGSGAMACEYAKVLEGLNKEYLVIGRGKSSAEYFKKNTGKDVITGGLNKFLSNKPTLPDCAIVCVGIETLSYVSQQLVDYPIKSILVEKPAGTNKKEIYELKKQSDIAGVDIYVAYNRRFYSSVIEAGKIIQDEGGVISFNFEFTEWSHVIEKLKKETGVKEHWFLANSTHVVDTAFFLGGVPLKYSCYVTGKENLAWHPASSVFSGSGITNKNALFSYQANWMAPGRWSVELLTSKSRLILRPMESLQLQRHSSIEIRTYTLDDQLDKNYKPGLYLQVKAFLEGNTTNLCHLNDHLKMVDIYYRIAGYDRAFNSGDYSLNKTELSD